MKLQTKSILVFVALLIAFLLVISVFFSTILLASYSTLEEQYIAKDLNQATNKLNDELLSMSFIASDWGPWDDTVDFVNGNDPEYLNSNLQSYGFDNLNLNLIVLTNTKGEVLFSGAYDLQKNVMVPVPAFFSGQLDLKNPLMNMSDSHHVTMGVLMLKEDPMLVVAQPIVFSNYSGPTQGVVIMGRYLDKMEIAKLAELTRPSFSLTRIDDAAMSLDLVSRIREKQRTGPGLIRPLNRDQITGSTLIQDIYGNDALVLQITENRNIYHQGLETTMLVIFIILAGGLFLGLGVIILQDRLVLKRMGSLAHQVNTIGKSGITRVPVDIQGDDELSGLAHEINRMLTTIEQAQFKVLESEAQFRDLVENLPDFIVVYGPDKKILYINPAVVRALGYDTEQMVGMPVLSYVAEEFQPIVTARMAALQEVDAIPIYESDLLAHDGLRRSVIVKCTKIQYHNNPATLMLLVDITPRKALEDQLTVRAAEISKISAAFQQANKKLMLLSSITRHDINNHLTVVLGYLSLMENTLPDPVLNENFLKIFTSAKRISSIIQFTREYEEIGTSDPVWQDIRTLADTAAKQAPLRKVKLKNDIPAGTEVFADPLIVKVFYNLIQNAVLYGGKITTIRFFLEEHDDYHVVVCQDDGEGVVAHEKKRIFNRGFGKNTGLGLALSREILDITGITISETGEPGKGARFELMVPKGAYRSSLVK
ncbi:MAG: CHASE4 domain-containing protein [Methanoregula sp.]|nr:CHASE4 domain-containing protein [Methanoregula sp.]